MLLVTVMVPKAGQMNKNPKEAKSGLDGICNKKHLPLWESAFCHHSV